MAATYRREAGVEAGVRETAATLVYKRLRDEVLTASLPPGAVLRESEIALAFGVSRTPVREAVLRLAVEALIEIRPRSGTFVSLLDPAMIREALFVREALETEAVRLTARRASAEERRGLADIVAAHRDAVARSDADAVRRWDEAFHRAIVQASGFAGAWRVVSEARDRHTRLHYLSRPLPGVASRAVAQHEAILAAVLAGDSDIAGRLLGEHIRANEQDLDALAAAMPGYFVASAA